MYTRSREPLRWVDSNRISAREMKDIVAGKLSTVIAVSGRQCLSRVTGTIAAEPYPTPDQLWRWTPQEKR